MGQNKSLLYLVVAGITLVLLFSMFSGNVGPGGARERSYTEFMTEIRDDKVEALTLQGNEFQGYEVTAELKGESGQIGPNRIYTFVPDNQMLLELAEERGIDVTIDRAEPQGGGGLGGSLYMLITVAIMIGIFVYLMRQMNGGGGKGGAMGFGKSRAKMLTEHHGRKTFEDVAGVDEAKQELEEVVEFLRDPHKFQRLGGTIPKGVLLVGPPGTGKTLLARAIAGEANVPFFTISGSDFVEMFVGVGASRVRDMFEQGKKNAPCIIFIDEIDAVGRHRGAGLGGGNDEREQTLNQLLVEMDGFEANEGVILIAATNRPDVLDPALLRPGRFDRQVVVPNPDLIGREKILRVHMRKVPLASDVDAKVLARGTPGFSGADLANMVNEAALLAARTNKRAVGMDDFEAAKDKVMMGVERRSMVMSDDEKKLTAYHEAGHALIGLEREDSDPIYKATIIPRGRALGFVMRLPEADRVSMSRAKLLADLDVTMGGRVAEEIIFGDSKVTTGASSDIQQATNIARKMVTEWGMSEKLGPMAYAAPQQEVFLGHSVTQNQSMAEETAREVDTEIRQIVDTAYQNAHEILNRRLDDLHTLAEALLKYETLSGDEIDKIMKGEELNRDDIDSFPPATGSTGGGPRTSVPTSDPDPDPGSDAEPQGA
ncbi:MAG: ATP-dependent zinc metalloprotease FtsH [Alphaproteobacteria bacterium]